MSGIFCDQSENSNLARLSQNTQRTFLSPISYLQGAIWRVGKQFEMIDSEINLFESTMKMWIWCLFGFNIKPNHATKILKNTGGSLFLNCVTPWHI